MSSNLVLTSVLCFWNYSNLHRRGCTQLTTINNHSRSRSSWMPLESMILYYSYSLISLEKTLKKLAGPSRWPPGLHWKVLNKMWFDLKVYSVWSFVGCLLGTQKVAYMKLYISVCHSPLFDSCIIFLRYKSGS